MTNQALLLIVGKFNMKFANDIIKAFDCDQKKNQSKLDQLFKDNIYLHYNEHCPNLLFYLLIRTENNKNLLSLRPETYDYIVRNSDLALFDKEENQALYLILQNNSSLQYNIAPVTFDYLIKNSPHSHKKISIYNSNIRAIMSNNVREKLNIDSTLLDFAVKNTNLKLSTLEGNHLIDFLTIHGKNVNFLPSTIDYLLQNSSLKHTDKYGHTPFSRFMVGLRRETVRLNEAQIKYLFDMHPDSESDMKIMYNLKTLKEEDYNFFKVLKSKSDLNSSILSANNINIGPTIKI